MARSVLRMDWVDALFAHWPVPEEVVQASLPAGLRARVHSGNAWLGIVAFVMESVRPRPLPPFLGLTFGEVNLRTYVRGPDGRPGIYFYSLDAADPVGVAVARTLYRLPYYRAAMAISRIAAPIDEAHSGRAVTVRSRRIHPGVPEARFGGRYRPAGDIFHPKEGSLVEFLMENYRFYLSRRDGGDESTPDLFAGDVEHEPWPLAEADFDLRHTNLFEVNGFDRPSDDPLVHYSPGVSVAAERIRRLG